MTRFAFDLGKVSHAVAFARRWATDWATWQIAVDLCMDEWDHDRNVQVEEG